jgi:hypothetical protein
MNIDLASALRRLLKSLCRAGLTAAITATPPLSSHSAENIPAVQATVTTVRLLPDEAQADFDFMRRVLEEAHPGLYR